MLVQAESVADHKTKSPHPRHQSWFESKNVKMSAWIKLDIGQRKGIKDVGALYVSLSRQTHIVKKCNVPLCFNESRNCYKTYHGQ